MEALNWDNVGNQAAQLLSRYIQLDTTNPPGNEAEAARFLEGFLSEHGVRSEIIASPNGRSNLIARLSGTGVRRPVILLHHMDVVPATTDEWSFPPFDGRIYSDHVWGRGAIDDKGLGVMHLMAFLQVAETAGQLDRDVILLAVSDEEEGGSEGIGWLLESHADALDAEFVWDEGGVGTIGVMGDRPFFAVSVAEKRSLVVTLRARAAGGHGSMAAETAIDNLTSALRWIADHPRPIRYGPVTREFFRRLAEVQPWPASTLIANAWKPGYRSLVQRRLDQVPSIRAMLRDTITPTVLNAGEKPNVAPSIAEATLDVRLLPETDPGDFLRWLSESLRPWSVEVEALPTGGDSVPSSTDTDLFKAMEKVIPTVVPGAVVSPILTPVATDSRYFRERGIASYGLMPALLGPDDLARIHGVDERISIENLALGTRIVYEVLLELCVTE